MSGKKRSWQFWVVYSIACVAIFFASMWISQAMNGGFNTQTQEPKSVIDYTKQEYIEASALKCSRHGDIGTEYCTCLYTDLLNDFTVSEVYDIDVEYNKTGIAPEAAHKSINKCKGILE